MWAKNEKREDLIQFWFISQTTIADCKLFYYHRDDKNGISCFVSF